MSNLEALKQQYAKLGDEIERLEKAEKQYNDHPHLFVADEGCPEWHGIEQDVYGEWDCFKTLSSSRTPVFRTEEIAKAHAEAQEIVHRVKAMGVAYVPGEWNWTILVNDNGEVSVENLSYVSNIATFGCFGIGDEGKARAWHAIDTVGKDNIAWAARVLAGGSIER